MNSLDGFKFSETMPELTSSKFKNFYDHTIASMNCSDPGILNSDLSYRVKTVLFGAKRALGIRGDFIDFGVWHGTLPYFINSLYNLELSGKRHYLFDTWGENWQKHDDPALKLGKIRYNIDIYSEVQTRFSKFPAVKLIRGVLPDSAYDIITRSSAISFVSIDVNSNSIELELLCMVWDRLSPGGMIYLDDYGFRKYPKIPVFVQKFLQNKSEDIFELPNGTAFIIKS